MTAGSWKQDWKDVKVDFKEATGKSKPDSVKKVLGIATVHKTDVAARLEEADEVWTEYRDGIGPIRQARDQKGRGKLIAVVYEALTGSAVR